MRASVPVYIMDKWLNRVGPYAMLVTFNDCQAALRSGYLSETETACGLYPTF